jgi:hypothetical protein
MLLNAPGWEGGMTEGQCGGPITTQAGAPPYFVNQEFELFPCCRPDGTCGYWDVWFGLGCAPGPAMDPDFGWEDMRPCEYQGP